MAVREIVLPVHMGVLLLADGARGDALTVTAIVTVGNAGHPGTVVFTEYVPAAEVVIELIVGF